MIKQKTNSTDGAIDKLSYNGRMPSGDDITHYQRVVVALKETIRLMKEIDRAIVKWPME
jgi:hypothetical protein